MGRVRNILVISLLAMVTSLTASAGAVSNSGGEAPRQTFRRISPTLQTPVVPNPQPGSSTADREAAVSPTVSSPDNLSSNSDAQPGDVEPAVYPTSTSLAAEGPTVIDEDAEPTAEPRGEAPVRLQIPVIGIDTSVEWVGTDESGAMRVPSTYTDVAWYELGPRPGERGNAVINGHLDSTTGTAVFWDLELLQPGDEIFVRTHGDRELRFIVTGIESFKTDEAPLDRIFGPTSERNLNLITCDGTFLRDIREYDQRLVVYTTLAQQ